MNTRVTFFYKQKDTDAEGFLTEENHPLADVRAYREDQHGTQSWRNRAAYTTANTLFRLRKIPHFHITTDMYIACCGEKFEIYSVEDIKGRGMYIEILAERMRPNGKMHDADARRFY